MNGGVPPRDEHVPQGEQVRIDNQGNELPAVPPDMTTERLEGIFLP